jgi:ATP-dependent 26S proteasome regulatory subunit
MNSVQEYLKSGCPAIWVLTSGDPFRAEKVIPCQGWRFLAWNTNSGIYQPNSSTLIDQIFDPLEAIRYLDTLQDTVLMMHNLHLFMESPEIIQAIQSGVNRWKQIGACMIVLSAVLQLRPELEKLFQIIDLDRPDTDALHSLQCDLGKTLNVRPNKKAARIASGMTSFEAEQAYSLSLVRTGYFSSKVVSDLKSQIIRKSGILELYEPTDIKDIGGLENIKAYIQKRVEAIQSNDLNRPKSMLLLGIPGCGKSLAAKSISKILNWPLIRFDIGALKGSLFGQSEANMREALKVIETCQCVVVFIDEIEKQFAGVKSSGHTDGGTTANLLSRFLTFMQDTRAQIFVVATANDISQLPPEMLRAGRFDTTFCIMLPTLPERKEIIKIMNRKYSADVPEDYAKHLQGFSGAEIELLVKESLYEGLDQAYESIVPLSRSMREQINNLNELAKRYRVANTAEIEPVHNRKIIKRSAYV